jgi:hypothetical protein
MEASVRTEPSNNICEEENAQIIHSGGGTCEDGGEDHCAGKTRRDVGLVYMARRDHFSPEAERASHQILFFESLIYRV